MLKQLKSKAWEVEQSSLARISEQKVSHEQCRDYACKDIVSKLTHVEKANFPFVMEIPKGVEFHFIGRVDTAIIGANNPSLYYNSFETRDFISFTSINNRNISHYKGNAFFIYDILPEDIVHIFPLDSSTNKHAKHESQLTVFPSLWITLKELEDITEKLGVYNQITCKTKRYGQIIKPVAVIAFNQIDDNIMKIAKQFDIGCVLVHPNEDAINYNDELTADLKKLNKVSAIMKELFGINVLSALIKNS